VVEPVIGAPIPLPPAITALLGKKKRSQMLAPHYNELKDFLLS
jgi:hypothetical protein